MEKDLKQPIPRLKIESLQKLIGLGFIMIGLWIASAVAIYFAFETWEIRGVFGDMFGAVNSLFSGLAFAGVIYTIFLQRRELALQRKETELNRKELERGIKAQEETEKVLIKQVEILEITAKLNAANILIAHYRDIELKHRNNSEASKNARSRYMRYIEEIETTLEKTP